MGTKEREREREKERDRKEKQKGGTTKKTANAQTNEEAAGRGAAPMSRATRREDNSVTGRGSAPTLAHAARNARKRKSGKKGGRPQLGRIGFQLI